jgi:hypothetical protein
MAAAVGKMAPMLLKSSTKIKPAISPRPPPRKRNIMSQSTGSKNNQKNSSKLNNFMDRFKSTNQKNNQTKSGKVNNFMEKFKSKISNLDPGLKSNIENGLQGIASKLSIDPVENNNLSDTGIPKPKQKKILEINKMIRTMLGGIYKIVPMLVYIVVLLILVLSLLNIIIFPIAVLSDWFSDDILIKDTFKYRLLEYASGNQNTESYFFLSYIKYLIFFMTACYFAVLIISMFTFILWCIATLFTLISSAYKLDDANYKASDFINQPVIMGLIVSIAVYGFHSLFFQKYISNQLANMKSDIDNVDKFIREELRSGSGYVKKDFFKIFREKSPGGIKKEGTAAGQIILKDVQDGNYQEAKTKTLFYILYSILYDNIPPQNPNKEIVAYYFLKNPQIQKDNSLEFNNEPRPMTFYSLFMDKSGPGCADHNAMDELEIFHLDNKKLKELKRDVEKILYELDEMLTRKINFENKSFVFGILILMLFFTILLLVAMFNFFILQSSEHGALHPMAKFVSRAYGETLMFISPQMGEWYNSISENKRTTEVIKAVTKN